MAYIKITDTWWTDGTNNEKIWEGEEIHKVGKYYVVNRNECRGNCKSVGTRYRISWNVHKKEWLTETKYYDVDQPTNKMHWHNWSSTKMETDLKPHIPKKQKKKIYGNAVICWGSEEGKDIRLVQLYYKKDDCYYFKTPELDVVGMWNRGKWMINSRGTLSIKDKHYGWSQVPTEPKPYNDYVWAKVVSLDIY